MATLTLSTIRSLVRDEINKTSTIVVTDTELNTIINDGYKDVAVKGLCYEKKFSFANIYANGRVVPLTGNNIIRVTYVEYAISSSEVNGIQQIQPTTIGYVDDNDSTPQYWFQWGDNLVIEPIPNVGTYDINVYAACYPDEAMSLDADTPHDLPESFHECIPKFAKAFVCLKLKRWGNAVANYNEYILNVQRKRLEYIEKIAETKKDKIIPETVTRTMVNK